MLKTTYSSVLSTSLSASIASVLGNVLHPGVYTVTNCCLIRIEFREPGVDAFEATSHLTRPIIPASHVTSSTGTGLVHTAPAHGVEDWQAWRSYCTTRSPSTPLSDVPCSVDSEGKFSATLEGMIEPQSMERLKGRDVLGNGTAEVIEILKECGTLIEEVSIQHKFPYDWRTKKPVIFR